MVLDGGLGVDDSALVREGHVGACEDVVGDCLAEDFDAEDVGDSVVFAISITSFIFVSWGEGRHTSLPSPSPNPDARGQHGRCSK